jgi:hypothetical protein
MIHQLFAFEALGRAFPESHGDFDQFRSVITFASQGPDFFFHNRMTEPFSTGYGKIMHQEGYGRTVSAMASGVRRSGAGSVSEAGAFVLAFMTHAVLDRAVHPFVIWHSGWVDPGRPESNKYQLCHAYFERILDVLVLAARKGVAVKEFDFFSQIDVGAEPPDWILELLLDAVGRSYPSSDAGSLTRQSLRSAYVDARWFWETTNPPEARRLKQSCPPDLLEPSRRFFALLYPVTLPEDLDFLNLGRDPWSHPWDESETSTQSFIDLYEGALEEAASVLVAIASYVDRGPGCDEFKAQRELEISLGNGSLETGKPYPLPALPLFAAPFPLDRMIEALYVR